MTKSVFVTGATGFVGSRLVENLVDKEYKVTSLIRKGNNPIPNQSRLSEI